MTTPCALPLAGLLRNTALEASLLGQGATAEAVPQLRQHCLALVAEFEAALEQRHVTADVTHDALYAQCGWLDEAVLMHLPDESRSQWEAQPLQVERFGKHDAGEHVFDRLAERMREAPPNVELLQCYATLLGLGFKGRYARAGETQRTALVKALNEQIARYVPKGDEGVVVDVARTSGFDWLRRLSPWAVAGLACAAAAIVFVAIGQGLDLQVSHLLAAIS
jgi:type VI secretion system protein ImpK